jgi:hypothetical protein
VAIYTSAKALSRWPINDESTLTNVRSEEAREFLHLIKLLLHSAILLLDLAVLCILLMPLLGLDCSNIWVDAVNEAGYLCRRPLKCKIRICKHPLRDVLL